MTRLFLIFTVILSALLIVSCNTAPNDSNTVSIDNNQLIVNDEDTKVNILLSPRVMLNGQWTDDVKVEQSLEYSGYYLRVCGLKEADKVNAFELEGEGVVPGAYAWQSDGFQSWSQSGMLALQERPSDKELMNELLKTGDPETQRNGNYFSWWTLLCGGNSSAFFAGALSAKLFKTWTQVYKNDEKLGFRVVSGLTGEAVSANEDGCINSEVYMISSGPDAVGLLHNYADALKKFKNPRSYASTAGWNSWYELFESVSETDILDNAARFKEIVSTRSFGSTPYIVIDDGWEKEWGEWEPNDKFPSGLADISKKIEEMGFKTGIWLAPLLVSDRSSIVKEHPDWFIRDISWSHIYNGKMHILDISNAGAREHLKSVISGLKSKGISLLKIDFLFAGTFEGKRSLDISGMEAYNLALKTIREASGDDELIVAVGAPGMPSIPYVNGWRIGGDIALENMDPAWAFVANQARTISARWYLCKAVQCDADPVLLRYLSEQEIYAASMIPAMAGGAFFLSDNLPLLSDEKLRFLPSQSIIDMSTSGIPAEPVDIFTDKPPDKLQNSIYDMLRGKNSHIVPGQWKMFNGQMLRINFDEEPARIDGETIPAHSAKLD